MTDARAVREGDDVREPPGQQRFGKDYYQRTCGLDDMRRFSMHWWAVRFYAQLARGILRRNGGRRVLEIGCAHGYTLARLAPDYETWGADISAYAIERARTNTPNSRLFVADLEAGQLPPGLATERFDLVIAKYVFEHLHRPADALQRVAGLLAPGGYLLYSVPDTRSPGRRLKGERWFAYGDETHVSLLVPGAWLDLTRAAGLDVRRSFSDGLWDVPYLPRVPRLLQYGIFSLPTIVSVFFGWTFIPAGWGENLIVLAQKTGVPERRSC